MKAMDTRLKSTLVLMIASLTVAGCERGERTATGSPSPAVQPSPLAGAPTAPATQVHDIRGTVVAIAPESGTVNVDHEEIPGVMAAMKMEYQVKDVGILDGLEPGDRVAGRLQVRDGDYLIIALAKERQR